jgi:hypothetical protein
MKHIRMLKMFSILILLICNILTAGYAISQPVVGLDTWFNHETDARTGQPFHYLWTDKAFSGYSGWGDIFTGLGARITTVARPESKILDRLDIYILADPDTTSENPLPNYIMPEDIAAIKEYVRKGGVLAVLANDAPNCEFTHLNNLMTEFGMRFNHITLHSVTGDNFEMGACTKLTDHPLFSGIHKIFIKDVSDISLSDGARSILTEKGKVLMAENRFGKGYVFAIGDPWIYNEYIDHDRLPEGFQNRLAALNLSKLLLGHSGKE